MATEVLAKRCGVLLPMPCSQDQCCGCMHQVMEEVVSRAVGGQEGRENTEWAAGALSHLHRCWGQRATSGSARSLGTSSPGPNQQNAWAELRLSLQRQEDSATCSGGLLTRDMQKHYPDRQGTGEHPEFS